MHAQSSEPARSNKADSMAKNDSEGLRGRVSDLSRHGTLALLLLASMPGGACTPMSTIDVERHRRTPRLEVTPSNSPAQAEDATSVEGRLLDTRIYGQGSRRILLLGAIHGDEPGSHLLVRDIEAWVQRQPALLEGLQLVVASPVNPDGLAAGTRRNARGVDLNRNFPSRNFTPSAVRGHEPLCEPEARFVHRLLIEHNPALVISVHQPRRSVNWDGPAEDLARAMAERCGYVAEATVGYSTPGSLGSYHGIDRKQAIITLELPRHPAAGKSFFDETQTAIEYAFDWVRNYGQRSEVPAAASR